MQFLNLDNPDLFSLQLPNPIEFLQKIINEDDIKTYKCLSIELNELTNKMGIDILYNSENYNKFVENLFINKANNIIKHFITLFNIHNNPPSIGYTFDYFIKKYEKELHKDILEQISIFENYPNAVKSENLLKISKYIAEFRTHDKSKKILIKFKDIKNLDVHIAYMKWIIDLSYIMVNSIPNKHSFLKKDEIIESHNSDRFWHSKIQTNIKVMEELQKYKELKKCSMLQCNSYCKICTKSMLNKLEI